MTWNRHTRQRGWVHPNIVLCAVVVKNTARTPEVPFKLTPIHGLSPRQPVDRVRPRASFVRAARNAFNASRALANAS